MCDKRKFGGTDEPISALAGRQHGVVSRSQVRELGYSDSDVNRRLRRSALLPIHRGVFAVGHRKLTTESRWMAAVLACGPGAMLSHRSAGQLWGIVPRTGSEPEVTRPRAFRARPGIRSHRATIPDDEMEAVEGVPTTSVTRTLFDLATIAARPRGPIRKRDLERAFNEAETRGLTSARSLPELLNRYPHRPGAALVRELLGGERVGITRSELEERFLALIDEHGLPRPELNADLAVRGRFVEVDCLWRAQRLIAELDGRAAHGTDRAFESDRGRDRVLLAEGWRTSRVTWRQLKDEPEAIVADLRQLLGTAYP